MLTEKAKIDWHGSLDLECSQKRQKTDHKQDTCISPEEALAKYDTMSIVLSFLGSRRDFGALIIVSKTMAPHIFKFMDAQVQLIRRH